MTAPTATSSLITAGYEPIPGYVLEELIGRGGFGEVWRANAPGDLKKAVKFVFGQNNRSHADRELRSLERMRQVRHPFLLTLERFEVFDDMLVIVTELADGSLEDVFQRHRDSGSCGIPRETLLKYLGDAAEALDHLHREYGLQHLDVKPANLMMVGQHVKVGDFGLLKDLGDTECSIVGGLTPIYAPPELFDGKPSMHSDQYSLAVMYQELLTGTRPFAGRTIAQLATQHVHSTPNLQPLPAKDRSTIAKALEKDFTRRFESCCDFLDALQDAKLAEASVRESEEAAVDIIDLPELSLGGSGGHAADVGVTDAVVIGIGGCGAAIMEQLRLRVAEVGHDRTRLTGLLIDTDLASGNDIRSLPEDQRPYRFLHTPLRSPNEYRQGDRSRFKTISRRWIYNVPRSLKTEGMRPLGRLALIDHSETFIAAVRDLLSPLRDEPSRLRVYVVGSISGGTCSGMYVDVVHQIRHLLDEAGLHEPSILSMLAMSSLRGDQSELLNCNNSRAALSELSYLLRADKSYPGDSGASFEPIPAARTPLRNLYMVSDHALSATGSTAVRTISDYVWADMLDRETHLDDVRRAGDSDDDRSTVQQALEGPVVRSVGVALLDLNPPIDQEVVAKVLVSDLVTRWLGNPKDAESRATSVSEKFGRRLGLHPQYVIRSILHAVLAEQVDAPEQWEAFLFGDCDSPPHTSIDFELLQRRTEQMTLEGKFDFVSATLTGQLSRETSIALSDRRMDLATMIAAIALLDFRCRRLGSRWLEERNVRGVSQAQLDFVQTVAESTRRVLQTVSEDCAHMIQRLECLSAIFAVTAVELKQELRANNLESMHDEIGPSARENILRQLHSQNVSAAIVRPLNDPNSNLNPTSLKTRLCEAALAPLVSAVQIDAGTTTVDPSVDHALSLAATMALHHQFESANGPRMLPPDMDRTQQFTGRELDDLSREPVTVEQAISMVRPELMDMGGQQRLLLIVGDVSQREMLETQVRQRHDGSLTVVESPGCPTMLVHEASGIALQTLIARLQVLGGDDRITGRLTSRIDIDW